MADRALHHFSALQHEGQNQLACAKPVAHVLHRRQQHLVEDAYRRGGALRRACLGHGGTEPNGDGLVEQRLDALFLPMEDARMNPLVDAQIGFGVVRGAVFVHLHVHPFKRGQEPRQRIFAAVIDQILGQCPMLRIDLGVRRQMDGIDDRQVETRLDAVVQERRVQHPARGQRNAERDVRQPEQCQNAWQLGLDAPDALDGLARVVAQLFLPRGDRKCQDVEDQ